MANLNDLVGQQVDNYEIRELIGQGGMAAVYLARDVVLQRDVVIKTMLPALAQNEELRLRFQREARTTAQLSHSNIVPVYTTGVLPTQEPYLALQYIEGGSLSDHLEQLAEQGRWLSTIYALAIVRQIADALTVAHQSNIIHRDIKPSNILLRLDGTPVLSDLGIAAVKQATTRLTQTGSVIGTPNYMSPEQASSQLIDGRSDVYSLGVILYELLSGRLPFDADSPWAMIHMHIYEKPTPLKQIRPDLTAQTYRVVETCLQKNPGDRYQGAWQLVAALDEALAAEDKNPQVSVGTWQPPVVQKILGRAPATRDRPAVPGSPRKWPRWLYGLIGVALLAAIAAGVLWQIGTPPAPAAEISSSPVVPAEDTGVAAAQPTSTLRPTTTPGLTSAGAEESGPPQPTEAVEIVVPAEASAPLETIDFTIHSTQTRNETNLQVAEGQHVLIEYVSGSWRAGPSPTWPMVGPAGDPQVPSKATFPIPDAPVVSLVAGVGDASPFVIGDRLQFESPVTGSLWLGANDDDFTDNQGSLVVRIIVEPIAPESAVVSYPDGLIAFSCGTGGRNQIYLSSLDSQSLFLLPNQPQNSIVPAFSRDGTQIAYRSNAGGSWQIYASNVDGTNLRQVTSGPENNYEAVWSPDSSRFAFVSDRSGSRQIFVMNGDGTNQRQLTFNDAYNDDPSWSVNDQIIYESNQDGRFNIYQILPQGGTPEIVVSSGATSTTPAWSRDGQWLAFESEDGNARHIWIATGTGTNLRRITSEDSDHQRPAWSPAGTRLAFHANYQQPDESLFDIWTIDIETGALQRITSRGDCFDPAWAQPNILMNSDSLVGDNETAGDGTPAGWPVSDTGVEACHLVIGMLVTAAENARLWNNPDVTAGFAGTTLPVGTRLRVIDGPIWGRVLRDQDESGWWWQVEGESDDVSGWIWQPRLQECEEP